MKSIISVVLGAVAMMPWFAIADAKEKSAAQCSWADAFDPANKLFVDGGGRYFCQVVRDEPCELWSLDAMAICNATVRLSYRRLGKGLWVVVLKRDTAAVLSLGIPVAAWH